MQESKVLQPMRRGTFIDIIAEAHAPASLHPFKGDFDAEEKKRIRCL